MHRTRNSRLFNFINVPSTHTWKNKILLVLFHPRFYALVFCLLWHCYFGRWSETPFAPSLETMQSAAALRLWFDAGGSGTTGSVYVGAGSRAVSSAAASLRPRRTFFRRRARSARRALLCLAAPPQTRLSYLPRVAFLFVLWGVKMCVCMCVCCVHCVRIVCVCVCVHVLAHMCVRACVCRLHPYPRVNEDFFFTGEKAMPQRSSSARESHSVRTALQT